MIIHLWSNLSTANEFLQTIIRFLTRFELAIFIPFILLAQKMLHFYLMHRRGTLLCNTVYQHKDGAGMTLFNSPLHGDRPVVLVAGGGGQWAEVFDYTNANAWEESKMTSDLIAVQINGIS